MQDNQSLLDRIKAAVNNITTLEVTTRVGEVNVIKARGKAPEIDIPEGTAPAAYTRIDLLGADTFNSVSPSLLNGPYTELRAFHQHAVKDAQDLLQKRLDLIERLVHWAAGGAGNELKDAIQNGSQDGGT